MSEEYLIKLIKPLPYLYDAKDKSFKNNDMKENSWKKVANAMEMSVDDCMRMWRNLRDKYARELKKMQQLRSSGQPSEPVWEYFYAMHFMKDVIKQRNRSYGKLKTPFAEKIKIVCPMPREVQESPVNSLETVWVGENEEIIDELNEDNFGEIKSEERDLVLDLEGADKIQIAESLDELTVVTKDLSSSIKKKLETKQNPNAAFGQYVAASLDTLSPDEQRRRRQQICQILEC